MVTLSKVHGTFTDSYLIDFRIPEVQDIIVEQAISVSQCGLFDGIQFDAWTEGEWLFLVDRFGDGSRRAYSTLEEGAGSTNLNPKTYPCQRARRFSHHLQQQSKQTSSLSSLHQR